MEFYHGTDQSFKKLEVNKTSEYGLYFSAEIEVANWYGTNLHTVKLNYSNLYDLTTFAGISKAVELLPELKNIFEEEGIEDSVISTFYLTASN